ncbi:MAG: ABC transporter ATP-binding protein [Patescibacteria group bacterium]
MSNTIISVKNIGKKYNITHQQGGYVALRDVLTNVFKNPFQFVKHKAKQITGMETKEEFWALKDVNFTVEKGEAIGIIGANGAGKSTLLKILTGITPPTTGEAIMRGKVASLLEVGTGFHPELTGRENIFLNGAILGMTKKEISDKFNDIVKFSGVEKFLDTPIKYYSSGMSVRLAFAVAAHLEPDILIIDEVLAVGDAEFQKKCLGKMDEITKKEKRTILFVSHNMGAVTQLCKRCILLNKGQISLINKTSEVVNYYINNLDTFYNSSSIDKLTNRKGTGKIKIIDYSLHNNSGKIITFLVCGQNIEIWLKYKIFNEDVSEFDVSLTIDDLFTQNRLAFLSNLIIKKKLKVNDQHLIKIKINNLPFNIGKYQFTIFLSIRDEITDWIQNAGLFSVNYGNFYKTGKLPPLNEQGNYLLDYDFSDD